MNNTQGKKVIKQHFIPRFYLKNFASDKKRFFCFRRKSTIFKANIENICAKKYLHEVERKASGTGEKHIKENYIEKQLSVVEGRLAPMYQKFLDCCCTRTMNCEDTRNGAYAVSYLMAMMTERHPIALDSRRQVAVDIAQRYIREEKYSDEDRRLLKSQGAEYDLVGLSELFAMEVALFPKDEKSPLLQLWHQLNSKRLVVLKAPIGTEFIATDLPIFFSEYDEASKDFKEAYMPLSHRFAALFLNEGKPFTVIDLPTAGVMSFNSRLLAAHQVWTVAFSKSKGPLSAARRDWHLEWCFVEPSK
ncbi:MAG: DUF4238 domain-containing protein [Coriobacteriaceae bacterium]|nr:DUF4238 domain-containing protein [Coriobacteriaceae bacterium]MDO4498647.1 DUF4238 domain-containing protein [Coriobacteriaceae bacterium]